MKIQFDFSGKGVLVADGASGLGRQVAAAFHELGASVAIQGRSAAQVDAAIRELGGGSRLIAATGDLAELAGIAKLVESAVGGLGRLDVLVCLGTRASLRDFTKIDTAYFEQAMAENVKQLFFLSQACIPALRRTRGSIVHVASSVGQVSGPRGAVAYATASGAMAHMARMMAIELAGDGIRVNALCSGWAEDADPAAVAAYREFFASRSPLRRLQTAEEVAAAVLCLAAPFSGYTNGAVLLADGGVASGHYVG